MVLSWSKSKFLTCYALVFAGTAAVVTYVCSLRMDKWAGIAGSPANPDSVQQEPPNIVPLNSTEIFEIATKKQYLMKVLSFFLGIIGMATNGFLLWVIRSEPELRKKREMILPQIQSVFDILRVYTRPLYTVRWSAVTFAGEAALKSSSVYCMATQQMILWLGASRTSSLIVANIAIDRLIAIKQPVRYGSLGRNYYRAHEVVIWGYFFWILLICFILSFYNDYRFDFQPHILTYCHNGLETYGYYYAQVIEMLRLVCLAFAAAVYFSVYMELRNYTKTRSHEAIKKVAMERQARITRTLGWVLLSTIIFEPIAPGMWVVINLLELDRNGWFVFTLHNYADYAQYFSMANNLWIWFKTNDEFKQCVRKKLGIKGKKGNGTFAGESSQPGTGTVNTNQAVRF